MITSRAALYFEFQIKIFDKMVMKDSPIDPKFFNNLIPFFQKRSCLLKQNSIKQTLVFFINYL